MTVKARKLLWGLQAYPLGFFLLRSRRHGRLVKKLQMKALRGIVRHAKHNVAYYKNLDAYRAIDTEADDFEERFKSLPVLTKNTIVDRFADLISNTVAYAIIGYTSGSTGKPMKFLKDLSRRPWQDGSVLRRKLLGGRSILRERLADIAESPESVRDAFVWRHGFGRIKTFLIEDPGLLDSLPAWKPTVISGWPDSLRWLCRRLEREGRIVRVPHVISHSSVLDEATRRQLETTFGAVVINEYGLNETGDVASTMCTSDHLHIDSELFYVETVDERGRPAGDGHPGEIVITVLHSKSFPMIRYATGDIASLSSGPFECGIDLPALFDIEGRKDDMVVLANGRVLTIGKMNMFFWGNMDLHQWRIWVEDPACVVVECEWRQHAGDRVKHDILVKLRGLLGDEIDITLIEAGIDHDPGRKRRYIIRGTYPKAIIDRRGDAT